MNMTLSQRDEKDHKNSHLQGVSLANGYFSLAKVTVYEIKLTETLTSILLAPPR